MAEPTCPCEDGLPDPCTLCGARVATDTCQIDTLIGWKHRAEAAEALAVPEGWKVEWGHSICTYPGCEGGELVNHRPPHEVTDLYPTVVVCPRCLGSAQRPGGPLPRLVPLSPTDTPEVSP